MFILKIYTVLVAVLLVVNAQGYFGRFRRSHCLRTESNPYILYSTKTSYDTVRGDADSQSVCKPVQIWHLVRHGTRYPSPKDTAGMKLGSELRDKILLNYALDYANNDDALCAADLQGLSTWEWDKTIESETYNLTEEGWREVKEIGQRFQRRLPELMSIYSPDQFYFRHTDRQRTWASCRAYIEGLFGSYEDVKVEAPTAVDNIVKPYMNCPAWREGIERNSEFRDKELIVLKEQTDYKQLVSDVSKRLGFRNNLTDDQIELMYNLCRFEKSWFPDQFSPWCSVFKKSDLLILEYFEDLNQYYKTGFSHEYNPKIGCLPLRHMMKNFEETIANNKAKPRVIGLFSHDTMLGLVFTTLRFGMDDTLLKGSEMNPNRKYRTSLHAPFSGNIAVVLHKCGLGKYEVQFFLNEKPMELAGCPKGLCSWEYLKDFLSMTKDCNLDFCYQQKKTVNVNI